MNCSIVIRNGKRVWKHGPNRPFFLYNLSSKNYLNPVYASLHGISTNKCEETIKKFKVKGFSSCFVLNLRMSGENCLIFNWHSPRAAPGISFFGVPAKHNEYCTNWRNIVAVITRDTVMKAI